MFAGTSSLACSWRMGITLLAFFGASSRLTQFREELKDVDESHRTGGQRNWQQVHRVCLQVCAHTDLSIFLPCAQQDGNVRMIIYIWASLSLQHSDACGVTPAIGHEALTAVLPQWQQS